MVLELDGMDVKVTLRVQGGHLWEFRCDENDPILSGLMSALPGSGSAANLPPDGLIQIENSTGTRLFLTQNSLVSLSVAPFNHDLRHPDST